MNAAQPAVGKNVVSHPPAAGMCGVTQLKGDRHNSAPSQAAGVCMGDAVCSTVNSAGKSIIE